MPPTNVPFVIDSTLTTDDSSLAGTVGNVIVYRKVEEEREKVTARVYTIDGDILDVAVAAVAAIAHAERAPPPEAGSNADVIINRLSAKEASPKRPRGNPYSQLAVEDEEVQGASSPTEAGNSEFVIRTSARLSAQEREATEMIVKGADYWLAAEASRVFARLHQNALAPTPSHLDVERTELIASTRVLRGAPFARALYRTSELGLL